MTEPPQVSCKCKHLEFLLKTIMLSSSLAAISQIVTFMVHLVGRVPLSIMTQEIKDRISLIVGVSDFILMLHGGMRTVDNIASIYGNILKSCERSRLRKIGDRVSFAVSDNMNLNGQLPHVVISSDFMALGRNTLRGRGSNPYCYIMYIHTYIYIYIYILYSYILIFL